MFQNKIAVIFDMDGTLIDSVGIWNQVDMEILRGLIFMPSGADTSLRNFTTSS